MNQENTKFQGFEFSLSEVSFNQQNTEENKTESESHSNQLNNNTKLTEKAEIQDLPLGQFIDIEPHNSFLSENKYQRASNFVLIEKNTAAGCDLGLEGETRTEVDPKSASVINEKMLENQNSRLSDNDKSINYASESPEVKLARFEEETTHKVEHSVAFNQTDTRTKEDTSYQSEVGKVAPSE